MSGAMAPKLGWSILGLVPSILSGQMPHFIGLLGLVLVVNDLSHEFFARSPQNLAVGRILGRTCKKLMRQVIYH